MKQVLFKRKKWKVPDIETYYRLNKRQIIKSAVICIIFLGIVSYLFYNTFLYVFVFCPYIHFHLKKKSLEQTINIKKEMNIKFKDGMTAVSFALNAGYSIENAFREALEELILLYGRESDIVKEFQIIIKRIDMNENIEDILEDFALKSNIEDIAYFSEVFRYAKRSGGDLIAIIKNTASHISEKQEVCREIETIISGKQLERKVMRVIPFGIIGYLKLASPEFIEPLYGNSAGVIIMTICLCIFLAAEIWAAKIVCIEV